MWLRICLFELRCRLRNPLFAVSAAAFFALGVLLASADVGAAVGDVPALRNAPIAIVGLMPIVSLLGLFVITAFVAGAAVRDFEHRAVPLVFTKPVGERDYLVGRFVGSTAVSLLVLSLAVLGIGVGMAAPWQPSDRIGPFTFTPYAFGWAMIVVPNLLFMGSLIFTLAIRGRRLSVAYVCVVLFIGLQDVLEILADALDSRIAGSLLEPSGIVALATASRYWTSVEQSARLPELWGVLTANRLLWLTGAALVTVTALRSFRLTGEEKPSKGRRRAPAPDPEPVEAPRPLRPPRIAPTFPLGGFPRRLLGQTRVELTEVVWSPAFLSLAVFGMMLVAAVAFVAGSHDGQPAHPRTHLMLRAVGLGAPPILTAILVLYAGELMYKRRSLKISAVFDALPVSNGLLAGAQALALTAVAGFFLAASAAATTVVQLVRGAGELDPGLYVRGLLVVGLPLLPVIALALFLQALGNHKLLGLLLTILALGSVFVLPRLGFESYLYLYGSRPPITYSVLNGYGHHLEPFLWHTAYWILGALVLLAATPLFWPRGTEVRSPAKRLRTARDRVSRAGIAVALVGILGMGATGSWIFYNTHERNPYLDRDRLHDRAAAYERAYGAYESAPLPRITSVFAEIDLFPDRRRAEIRGRYRLENHGDGPIRALPITRSPRWAEGVLPVYGGVRFEKLEPSVAHGRTVDDDELGFYVLELDRALEPGESLDLDFTVTVDHGGFRNRRHEQILVENGTFFSNRSVLPFVGYARGHELQDPVERRRRDLPPLERAADLDDADARERSYLEADWIELETVISTRADQVALGSGDLVREWTEGERRYFHYRSSTPVLEFFPVLSGAYERRTRQWGEVEIELYAHPDHLTNAEHLLDVAERTLASLSERLGPYPHERLRIAEIPIYHGKIAFAFSQVLAISEAWGFEADLRDPEGFEVDWAAAILAHEVAHQWWNHQVVPGNAQGATLIAESLPQYAATQVLRELYGDEAVNRFLEIHLDRYRKGRADEPLRELPLFRVENQGYLHYHKGAIAFHRLAEKAGEEAVDRALRSFFEAHTFAGPPYAGSRDLLDHLRREIPSEHHGLVERLFQSTEPLGDMKPPEAADGT